MRWVKWRRFIALFKLNWNIYFRKCPCDHWLTNKAYLSAIAVTNISQSFTIDSVTSLQPMYAYTKVYKWRTCVECKWTRRCRVILLSASVHPRTSARQPTTRQQLSINSVFSRLRTLTTCHCPHSPTAAAADDLHLLPAGPTAANLQQRVCCGPTLEEAGGQVDGRTDGRTPYRFIDSAAHAMRAVPTGSWAVAEGPRDAVC